MNPQNSQRLGLRNVINLGIVSLFTDISTEMILGILPSFVIDDLHATKALLGLMEGAAESLNYGFRVASGVISDFFRRRKLIVLLGYVLSSFTKPLFAVAVSWSDALVVRLADRTGKGIRTPPRDALISDSVAETQSGRAFGAHRSLDQTGAIIGPALSYALIPLIGTRNLFLFSLVPGAISIMVLILFVRDRVRVRKRGGAIRNARAVLNKRFVLFLGVVGVFALGAYNFSFVLVKGGSLGVDSRTIPLVYATLNVGTVLAGFPAGVLADRISKVSVLMISFAFFFASSFVSMSVSGGTIFAFVIALVYGLYLGISDTVQRAIVPALTPVELKGTAYALYYLLIALCSLVANLVFGILWDRVSMSAAFEYSLATSGAAIIGLLLLQLNRA